MNSVQPAGPEAVLDRAVSDARAEQLGAAYNALLAEDSADAEARTGRAGVELRLDEPESAALDFTLLLEAAESPEARDSPNENTAKNPTGPSTAVSAPVIPLPASRAAWTPQRAAWPGWNGFVIVPKFCWQPEASETAMARACSRRPGGTRSL